MLLSFTFHLVKSIKSTIIFYFSFSSLSLWHSLYIPNSLYPVAFPRYFFFLHEACDRHMFCRPRGKKRVVIHLAQKNIIPVSVKTGGMESRWSIVPPGPFSMVWLPIHRSGTPHQGRHGHSTYNRRFRGTEQREGQGRQGHRKT